MGLFSKALNFLRHPLDPEARAESFAGSTRALLMDVLKFFPSTARAAIRAPFALASGSLDAAGTFIGNRITFFRRVLRDTLSRVMNPLAGNVWTRFLDRHRFERRIWDSFGENLAPLAEPLSLSVDVPVQGFDVVKNGLKGVVVACRGALNFVFGGPKSETQPSSPNLQPVPA